MKKFMILLSAIIAAAGCGLIPDDDATQGPVIELTDDAKQNIEIDPAGDVVFVYFNATDSWSTRLSDGSEWLDVSPAEGEAGKKARLRVNADSNTSGSERSAVIELCSGDESVPVTVSQQVFVPTFELSSTSKEMSSLGGILSVQIYSDVDYEYDVLADWISPMESKAPKNSVVKFAVDPNEGEERTGLITFCAAGVCKSFTVIQRAGGTAQEDWMIDQFKHRSLAMRFTADWCGYCPYMATAFESARSQMEGALELVSLHGGGSSYEFSETTRLQSRFGVTGLPTGIVDARASIPNYSYTSTTAAAVVDVAKETQSVYPASVGIACSSSLTGTNLTVDLNLYFKEAGAYRVVVLLLEDGIVGYQSGGGNDYEHNDVARMALTSVSGEAVKISEDFEVLESSYTATIKSSWVKENLKLLVYVEKSYGDREKVQNVDEAEYGKFGETYIDNCRVIPVGEIAGLEIQ